MSERTERVTEQGERVSWAENKRGVIFGWPHVKWERVNGRERVCLSEMGLVIVENIENLE